MSKKLNQAIVLKIFETLFNRGDYAARLLLDFVCIVLLALSVTVCPTHPTLTTHQMPWQTGHRISQRYLVSLPAMRLEYVGERWNYDTCVISLRSLKPKV